MNQAKKSVVCVPTALRPEMLALSLEKISQAPEVQELDIRIFLDTCDDAKADEVEFVRDTYCPIAEIFSAGEHIKVPSGTWNILQSLKNGFETGADLIYLVEEDIQIAPFSFFKWHEETHAAGDYFVTCGRRCGKMPADFYSNPGTCYRRKSLEKVIPHICDEFFVDTTKYLDKHFPLMKGMDGNLDDGLIRKVARSVGGKVLCAEPPVAFHQGFHYYNRFPEYKNEGTIQERIEKLRKMLPTIDPRGRYTSDYEPFILGDQNLVQP